MCFWCGLAYSSSVKVIAVYTCILCVYRHFVCLNLQTLHSNEDIFQTVLSADVAPWCLATFLIKTELKGHRRYWLCKKSATAKLDEKMQRKSLTLTQGSVIRWGLLDVLKDTEGFMSQNVIPHKDVIINDLEWFNSLPCFNYKF